MYRLAAAVEDWPRLLPHYRWVRVLTSDAAQRERTVEMAARRVVFGPLAVPLRWTAIQALYPESTRIEFKHLRGPTRGMWVVWTIDPDQDRRHALVQIRHVFRPRWPLPEALLRAVVGEYFVNGIARLTLAQLADLAQRTS
jgi:ribosome-associated toxin RatA of RatAB toxin-antitoxin module